MKRCPECRRDYTDETLNFCLDDGSPLLDGPSTGGGPSGEPETAIMHKAAPSSGSATRQIEGDIRDSNVDGPGPSTLMRGGRVICVVRSCRFRPRDLLY